MIQTQELNTAMVTLDSIRKQDTEILALREQVVAAKAEARLAQQLADLRVEQAKQEEKVVTISTEGSWRNEPQIVGTKNLDNVIADIRKDMDATYTAKISTLETKLEEKVKNIKDLQDQVRQASIDYSKKADALSKENELINRAKTLELETEKVALAEAHAKKLASFKDQKAELEKELADVRNELELEKTNKTDRELSAAIQEELKKATEEIEKLHKENTILRKGFSFKIFGLQMLNMLTGKAEWSSDRLRMAIARRYNTWRF